MSTYLRFLCLFLLLFLRISDVFALLISQTSENSSLAMFKNHCTHRPTLISHMPKYYDCLHAISYLPTRPNHEEGPFHNGLPEDPYQLPVAKFYNTCKVRVELHAGMAVFKESWAGVKGAAWLLNKGCLKSVGREGQLYAGGWTTWGSHERIGITLAFSDELSEVGRSNVSVA